MQQTPPESLAEAPVSPFSIPIFRNVWLANLASNFGSLVQSVGAAWLMTTLSNSPSDVALVQASTALPIMLFSLWAGALADNLDRRIMMLCTQSFMLIVSVGLTLFAWSGALTPALLLTFTFLIGCGTAFNSPAWQASVGDMVPRPVLPSAVALNSMGFNIARSVGPGIGGIIIATAGAAAAFLVNAFSYLGLIFVLLKWKSPENTRLLPREPTSNAILAGLRYVSLSPKIQITLLRATLFAIAASAVPALMPLVAKDLLQGGPLIYGGLLGAFGIGAVLGAFSSRRLRVRLSTDGIIRLSSTALVIGVTITAFSGSVLLTIPALMIAGAGWVLALSTFNVAIQLSAPRWVVARSLSIYQMAAFGGMALGSATFGYVSEHYGLRDALLAAAAFQAFGMIVGLFVKLPQVENIDLDPLGRWKEPDIALPIEQRSGPIVITVEYRVADRDIASFLSAMRERRRICRRDGAFRWTLSRDLNDPEKWVERYRVPTWIDYVRNTQRRTKADADVGDAIRRLMKDGQKPVVSRMIEQQMSADAYAGAKAATSPPEPSET
ncbi:MAG: MFS transporter [Hyphomonas sp.]|uniref:MFS transporter n=1 Tax=Hyphomonas sp. TaxID=87 RepID=UPI003002F0C5